MRLESYEPKVQPNTSAGGGGQVSSNISAYGNTADSYAMAVKAFDDWKEVALKKEENEIKLQTMNAQTDYNRRIMDLLYNDKDGLAHTELKDAAESAQRFRDAEAQIRKEVMGNLKYVRAQDDFKQHADSMTTKFNTTMETHEREQGDKYRDISFDNNVQSTAEMLQLGAYKNTNLLGNSFDTLKKLVQSNYGDRGDEYVESLYNKQVNSIAKSLMITMQEKEDYDGILAAIPVLREKGVDESILAEAETKTNKTKFNLTLDKETEAYISANGYDEAGIQKSVQQYTEKIKKLSTSMDGSKLVGAARQWVGTPYVLGGRSKAGIDCAGFTKAVADATGLSLAHDTADGQYIDFEQKGQIYTDAKQLQPGDFVFYHIPGNEATWPTSMNPADTDRGMAYKGVTHVGIYIGDGKVIQAGSSNGVTESPIQLADDYTIVGYGRTSGMGSTPISDAQVQEKTKQFEQNLRQKAGRMQALENQRLAQEVERVQAFLYDASKNGTSAADTLAAVDSMVGDNPKLKARLAGTMRGLESAKKTEERIAAGLLVKKMDAVTMNMAVSDIELDGVSVEEEIKKLEEGGFSLTPENVVALNKAGERAKNGTGAQQYMGQLQAYLGITGTTLPESSMKAVLVSAAPDIGAIRKTGREPTPDELNTIFANKINNVEIKWDRYGGLSSVIPRLGGRMAVAPYVLQEHGIRSATKLKGDDGAYYMRVRYNDNSTRDIWIEDFYNMYNQWTK